ncbi:MAG: TIGR01212 family radical SAM protein [Bacteroidales bacterium]|nr:TIGR01212 family radical SAM protein [Bacteroidales bacterium]
MTKNKIHEWRHERPFNSYSNYIRERFGGRIQKISLNGGFSCPNRDGRVGVGGCAFCNNDAFITAYCTAEHGIERQIADGKVFVKRRYRKARQFFAYFQAYTNTYTSIENLRNLFAQVLADPEIVGVIVGTRPDCIDNEKLEFFAKMAQTHYVVLEYGVESIYAKTLQRINRGHSYAQSVEAIEKTARYGIPVGAHIILGLPGETHEEMMAMATEISKLPLHSLKLHQLHIVKNTAFAEEYEQNPQHFHLFSVEEYIPFVAEFVSRLSPVIKIERFAGDSPRRVRIAPVWEGVKYETFVQKLEDYMLRNELWQGKLFCGELRIES